MFLVAILIANPGRIDRRGRQVRGLSIGPVVVIAGGAAWATGRLVAELVHGQAQTSDAGELLLAGALVWIETIIAFTFLFWELDSGGPADRYFRVATYPDFAFPEQTNPRVGTARLGSGSSSITAISR